METLGADGECAEMVVMFKAMLVLVMNEVFIMGCVPCECMYRAATGDNIMDIMSARIFILKRLFKSNEIRI